MKLENTSLGSPSGKMPMKTCPKRLLRATSSRSSAALFSHSSTFLCFPRPYWKSLFNIDQKCFTLPLQAREFRGVEAREVQHAEQQPFRGNPHLCASVGEISIKCNFGAELDNHLRDRLTADINEAALQRKVLLQERQTFSSLRTLCEKFVILLHNCRNGSN